VRGLGQRMVECPTPLLFRDKSQSVRARCNKAPRLPSLIFSGGIRTSGLEVLPKGALRCFQCNLVPSKEEALKTLPRIAVAVPPKRALEHWTGAVKGSTQGASKDSSCGASQESTGASKGAFTVLSMQSGAVKGSTQGASQDSSCGHPKKALDLRKFLQWEKHKQGELEVLPKRVLTCFQSMPDKCLEP